MIIAYIGIGLCILLLLFAFKSHKMMYFLSIMHSLSYLALTVWILNNLKLPIVYSPSSYFYMDYLSIFEVMIASIIFLCAAIYSRGYLKSLITIQELKKENLKLFYIPFNLLLTVTAVSFFINNLALFWIFAELTTLFSVVLIVVLNAKKNIDAALKYLFVSSTSMLFSFIGLIFLFALTKSTLGKGTLNWTVLMESAKLLPPVFLNAAFVFIFIGFAAKAGIFPFHTWLPHAHSRAPSVVSGILSGVLLNIGIYGIIRMNAVLHQSAELSFGMQYFLIFFGVVTIAVSSFCMLRRNNLKKLIAFSSIEHMGFLLVGIGIWSPVALFLVLIHIISHSLIKSLMFFSAGILHRQYHSNNVNFIINAFKLQPFASAMLIIGTIAIIGLPPFALFISKLLILQQLADISHWLLFAILVFMLIAAYAIVSFLVKIFTGEKKDAKINQYITPFTMKLPLIALIIMALLIGLFMPDWLKDWLLTIVNEIMRI